MSGKARRAASASEQNVRNLMSRREFLRRVGGAAGAAALPSLPPAAAALTQAAVPAIDPKLLLPPALVKGFNMPHGFGELVGQGPLTANWNADPALASLSRPQMQEIVAAMRRAKQTYPGRDLAMQKLGPLVDESASNDVYPDLAFNHLTGQWHATVRLPMPDGTIQTRYMIAGQQPPRELWDLQHLADMRRDLQESAHFEATLYEPSGLYKIYANNPPAPRFVDADSDPRETRWTFDLDRGDMADNLERNWLNERKYLFREQMQKTDNDARKVEPQLLDDLGLAPGGRYSMPPALQDTGTPTGLMSLLDDPSAPADDIQPNKLWQGRYPKGMYRAAAGSALAGLLAPIVMQESQDGR